MAQPSRGRSRLPLVAATAAVAAVAGMVSTAGAGAAPARSKLAPGIVTSHHSLAGVHADAVPRGLAGAGSQLPAGVPAHGRYAFLLKLDARTTNAAYVAARSIGKAAARDAARAQLHTVTAAQNRVISALPSGSNVVYRTHAVLAGLAVTTNVKNYQALTHLSGVAAVYPIAPKSPSNSYAVPLQHAPEAWQAHGDLGANSTVAIIDTGIDYTHADFGGVGTVQEYQDSKAQLGEPVSAGEFPGPKVIGGYDLAGDDYNGSGGTPPSPDPWPLDCNGHGSHVAGTVAGYGVDSNGNTYDGSYDTTTPFGDLRIGPGMAPLAKLYAYRVFGCEGDSFLVGDAIDMAADPNGDGDPSDHVDVVNMSLGSDYGSPQDGDSVLTDAASQLGITMVVASGNAGDLYDVGGSPGDAPRALTAAASQDEYSQVDALNVSAPESIAGTYAAERSIAYDWTNDPDLSGDVAQVTEASNLDGCDPLNTADAAAVNGKIAFVEWDDNDTTRRCGSVARSANLVAAGAIGFIFGSNEESFSAGITGSAVIPGVLVAKSGADAIRAELVADHTVSISGTTANGFAQFVSGLNDTLAGFSSRGINDAGNVKPDVTAVGVSVFSAGNGTGNQGLNDSGTSMATPMVAGTAALVRSLHPEWNPEQVKADIMNTADQDLYQGINHTVPKYAPNRVGSGRIDVESALDNQTLAYSIDNGSGGTDNGTVSASFGPVAVTPSADPTVLTRTIKVQNTSLNTVTYDVSYDERTSIPGADYTVSPDTVTIDPRSSKTVTVTLTITPGELTKTIDPTVDRFQAIANRQYQADASGNVVFSSQDELPNLRVPVYAAPRPASAMTQPSSFSLSGGPVQTRLLPLSGQQVDQGSGDTLVQSTVAGFELQATSGLAPNCSVTVTAGCVNFPDEREADIRYVGATSDAPQLEANDQNPLEDGLAYFAVSAQAPWRTPTGSMEYDIYIDSTGDGVADAVLFNTNFTTATGTDVMVTELFDLNLGEVTDLELVNASDGSTDTALFNSDTLVMPVWLGALPGLAEGASRITYTVQSFSMYQSAPVDHIGNVDGDLNITGGKSLDVLNPGLTVTGSYDGNASPLLFRDAPGSVLAVRRDVAAYAADHGKGALLVHFQNEVGNKAQVMSLNKNTAHVSLLMAPNPVAKGHPVTAVITVSGIDGIPPTGRVVLRRTDGPNPHVVARGTLTHGTATLSFTPGMKGTLHYQATYRGDFTYASASSSVKALQVT